MKFEKLNQDKIKVTLNVDDLSANDIDLNSFMSDSNETHSLFLNVLEKAERDYGFSTKDYNLKVETVALSNGNFVLTITRALDSSLPTFDDISRKKVHANRRLPKIDSSTVVYRFNTFDDFCNLEATLCNNILINYKQIAKNSVLYNYKNRYYLALININTKSHTLKNFLSLITEFATYINSSDIYLAKLNESGTIIFNKKAIENGIKYFIQR